ncbi:IS66 family transposase [Burkholderia sp. Bp9142]|uniref:IS66 family transposase n=1 Tax=Burkholderia sp. Bp9142 TaxID=2184573 RepID=UPI0021AB876A|nr:IS66 family transposase [Burkholderia sp. Bp9142]
MAPARRQWQYLIRYVDDSRLPIDNNWVHAASGMNPVMPTSGLCRVIHARGGGYGPP